MKVDSDKKKIALSIRRAQPAHWDGIVDRYQVGEVVPGIVTKLATFGAFARIEGPVEGLIHVSELVDRRINHSQEAVREGDILPLRIIRIERDRHRLGLSLKQARDQGERMGFAFSSDGEVTYVPPHIREAFQDEITALMAERSESRDVEDAEDGEREPVGAAAPAAAAVATSTPASSAVAEVAVKQAVPDRDVDDDIPQTQMAAAFAALKEQMASETPPEETKA